MYLFYYHITFYSISVLFVLFLFTEWDGDLEIHRWDESGEGVLPPPEPAVVLVVAKPVHYVDEDDHCEEDVDHGPGEEPGPRPSQVWAPQPVNLNTNNGYFSQYLCRLSAVL